MWFDLARAFELFARFGMPAMQKCGVSDYESALPRWGQRIWKDVPLDLPLVRHVAATTGVCWRGDWQFITFCNGWPRVFANVGHADGC